MIYRTFFLLLLISMPCMAMKPERLAQQLVENATSQIGVTIRYDPEYRIMAYPNGDVPQDRGVCSDVIIRAYRKAGIDLQRLVHADMQQHFAIYPRLWKLSHTDTNIDHRRVPNLMVFFTRHGDKLAISRKAEDYHPGDIVIWRLSSGQTHIGLVSDRQKDGRPLMLHNIGEGTQREDVLFAFTIIGHYRFLPV